MRFAVFFCLLSVVTLHCNTASTQVINGKAVAAAQAAERFVAEGKMVEAQAMIYQLQYLHPNDPAVRRLQDKLTISYRTDLESLKMLGVNAVRKKRAERSTGQKILYYLPDLIGDFKDIFSLDISLGPQIGFDLHGTRAVNFTAYTGATTALGTYPKQWAAVRGEASIELSAGPVGLNAVSGMAASPLVAFAGSEGFLLHRPGNTIYQTYRDYWSVGGKVGLLFVGVSFEAHPVEAVDFLTAVYGQDLLDDNLQATENFSFTPEETKILSDLTKYVSYGRLSKYHSDFPELRYQQVTITEADKRIAIAGKGGNNDPAKVIVLNFSNRTGSANYGYVSTSLSSAIYDSMKEGFIFTGGNPDANQKILGEVHPPADANADWYQGICEKTGADYLILGSFARGQKNTITIDTRVYGSKQKRVLLEIPKTTKTDASLFGTTQQISDEVVKLMKKIPPT